MTVSLCIPDFSFTLGGFDLSPYINFRLGCPQSEITTPQSRTGQFSLNVNGLVLDASQFDDQLLPDRWNRGQKEIILSFFGQKHFTGFILTYRYNRTTKTGQGTFGDRIALQDFDRPAINIPIDVTIRDKTESDRYSDFLDSRSRSIAGIGTVGVAAPVELISASEKAKIEFNQTNRISFSNKFFKPFIFKGTDTGIIAYKLAIESGLVAGVQIFSDVATPQLTGDITSPVVSSNPIKDAQKLAGIDSTWMYCDKNGAIRWVKYESSGIPLFQLTQEQTAEFEPNLIDRIDRFETVIVTGSANILTNNPCYVPPSKVIINTAPEFSGSGTNFVRNEPVLKVFEQSAIGDRYKTETIPIAGIAKFAPTTFSTYSPKIKEIPIGYLYSRAQANKLAMFLGSLGIQKANSYLIKTPIIPEWISNFKPFQICHIADGAFIMDAVEIVVEAKQAYLIFTGNKIGTIPTVTNPANPPAIPTLSYSVSANTESIERELSDIGLVPTTVSAIDKPEREYFGASPLVAGFAQWHRSEEGLVLGVDPAIAQWQDLSGNKRDFLARLGNEPSTEKISRLNGKQVITWLNVGNVFILPEQVISSPQTIFLVLRGQTWTGSRRILGMGGLQLILNGTALTVTVGASSLTNTLPNNTWALITIVADGANSRLKVGSSEVTGTLEAFTADSVILGAAAGFRLAEFIRYGFAMNLGDRALVENYIEDRYNLSLRSADPDVAGTRAPIVPPPPSVNPSGSFTNANITLSNGIVTAASNGIAREITTTSVKSVNYTAVSGDRIPCNTSAGTFTITFPATGVVEIVDVIGNSPTQGFGVNYLELVAGSIQIMGGTPYRMDVGARSRIFERIGNEWRAR